VEGNGGKFLYIDGSEESTWFVTRRGENRTNTNKVFKKVPWVVSKDKYNQGAEEVPVKRNKTCWTQMFSPYRFREGPCNKAPNLKTVGQHWNQIDRKGLGENIGESTGGSFPEGRDREQ